MSTRLWENENLSLVRFFGGTERGVMYQLTMLKTPLMRSPHDNGYIHVTRQDLTELTRFLATYKEDL